MGDVQVVYFDEVKYQKGRSPFYWLGAVIAGADLIQDLERRVNDLAEEVFGSRVLGKDTEFHASDLLSGNKQFKGWDLSKRIDTLKKLITVFGTAEGLGKVYVKMDVERMVRDDVEGMAFMFLVERVDLYLRRAQSPGLLIGDRENETIAGKFAEKLSRYRETGTEYEFGQQLQRLLDTVHFTHSHHSRMLQLADLHTWLRHLRAMHGKGPWHRTQILKHVSSINDCLFAHRYKEWPTDASRIKS